MDTGSFIVHLTTDDIYKDIAKDVETRFHTSNLAIDRPLPKGKNQKSIELMKDELGGQIMKQFVGLIAKTQSYLKDNYDEDKKAKRTKTCFIKRKLILEDYKNSLEESQIDKKINYLRKKTDVDSLKKDEKELLKAVVS